MRLIEWRKPKEIGRIFCIRPEKINALIKQFVLNAEDWALRNEICAQERQILIS